jgi:peptide/nickel transport system substrate-binding protein
VRVRRAIAHAIDVNFFIENLIYGEGKPATGPIPSSSTEFYPGNKPPYDLRSKKSPRSSTRPATSGAPAARAFP